jgi:hypothetical protein
MNDILDGASRIGGIRSPLYFISRPTNKLIGDLKELLRDANGARTRRLPPGLLLFVSSVRPVERRTIIEIMRNNDCFLRVICAGMTSGRFVAAFEFDSYQKPLPLKDIVFTRKISLKEYREVESAFGVLWNAGLYLDDAFKSTSALVSRTSGRIYFADISAIGKLKRRASRLRFNSGCELIIPASYARSEYLVRMAGDLDHPFLERSDVDFLKEMWPRVRPSLRAALEKVVGSFSAQRRTRNDEPIKESPKKPSVTLRKIVILPGSEKKAWKPRQHGVSWRPKKTLLRYTRYPISDSISSNNNNNRLRLRNDAPENRLHERNWNSEVAAAHPEPVMIGEPQTNVNKKTNDGNYPLNALFFGTPAKNNSVGGRVNKPLNAAVNGGGNRPPNIYTNTNSNIEEASLKNWHIPNEQTEVDAAFQRATHENSLFKSFFAREDIQNLLRSLPYLPKTEIKQKKDEIAAKMKNFVEGLSPDPVTRKTYLRKLQMKLWHGNDSIYRTLNGWTPSAAESRVEEYIEKFIDDGGKPEFPLSKKVRTWAETQIKNARNRQFFYWRLQQAANEGRIDKKIPWLWGNTKYVYTPKPSPA